LYDLDYKILYYISNSLNELCTDLGIHYYSYKKGIINDSPILNFFRVSKILRTEAIPTNLSCLELRYLIIKRKKESLDKLYLSYGKVVEVFDKETKDIMTFTSINKASCKFGVSRTTIRNYITSDKLYKNRYYFKFSDKI
jgi:NUMOD1 domain.